jgi:hypothetical protein
MLRSGSLQQLRINEEPSTANTWHKDESNVKTQDRIPCAPDSALKSFSPYACDDSIGTCSSDNSDFENEDEDVMPPPSPYMPLNSGDGQCTDVFKLGVMSTLSRPRSASPKRNGGMPKGRGMQRIRSLPNMEYGRASYNRGIGQFMLERITEVDKEKSKEDAAKKVAQFDALLEDI